MIKFGKAVVKWRVPILILSLLLMIPAAIGYFNTRVNYDILSYLPKDIETMEGQDILLNEFGTGAFSLIVIDNTDDKQIEAIADGISDVDHVKKVLWYGSVADLSIPRDILPEKMYEFFNNADANSQLMAVIYDESMASDETMEALDRIDELVDEHCHVSGMASVIRDIKNLSEKETPIYVVIAVVLSLIILMLTMDSALAPVLFLLSIGMAIVYNMGTNFMGDGEISYVTQALAAVLQLGVTMDYSIFLWHSYEEQTERFNGDKKRAMAHAISNTITSVVGSSITTVAGFIALCFMSFTLGLDLGIVMAKGVLFGVLGCVTILPSMILICDKAVQKTRHRVIIPDLGVIADWITKHYLIFIALFLVILGPAIYGYTHTKVYYDLAGSLPDTLASRQADATLQEQYEMGATHIVLADANMTEKTCNDMVSELKSVDGVKNVLALDSFLGGTIPEEILPDKVREIFKNGNYQMMLVSNEYAIASDEVNDQIEQLNKIVKSYDDKAMVIGEAPCTKDLIEITNLDFARVSAVSIGAIFLIILIVFKSISLPIILVAVIEFAIFINMGIPAYTGTVLPFIASIVIGTIQLGATVDYAILMTNKYKKNRFLGMDKQPAIAAALKSSIQSIMVSAFAFFAATFGVGMYSDIDMISSLCILMARGAIISMFTVIFVLPSMFMVFDKIIIHSSVGFRDKSKISTRPATVGK
ncbi:MAG: MMPL family transporter [Agathobacter sp.]|uniref:efflux RND transporter permease subunit n=1 Tax=Agathobacter sp. TaxID=2021311 RepID=UPI002590FD08|nr:MMPL family transporter [Agathobacter sp.]MCR5677283.1 MMPL family transporter [Agathobacter sp.]